MSAGGASVFRRPDDAVEALSAVVQSARRAAFWRRKLAPAPAPAVIRSLADFEALPITTASEYRRQPFGDVLADPAGVGWIPGPPLGQSPRRVAVAEGADEARVRITALTRALSLAVPPGYDDRASAAALVATTAAGRYFGAEMCAALIRMGVPAHLVTDAGSADLAAAVRRLRPAILGALTPALDLADLPRSVVGVITAFGGGGATSPSAARRVEILIQNELGVLGCALDGGNLGMNADLFHFETSANGTLVATPYFSRVQPIVRLDTGIVLPIPSP